MKKLSLELDALKVETFEPVVRETSREGTVKAFDSSYDEDTCVGPSCRRACTWQTCFPTCNTGVCGGCF